VDAPAVGFVIGGADAAGVAAAAGDCALPEEAGLAELEELGGLAAGGAALGAASAFPKIADLILPKKLIQSSP
jgi:hypothetical protein